MTHINDHTILCPKNRLDILLRVGLLRQSAENGGGWVWNHKGLEKYIPNDDLVEMLRLYENATANKDSRVRIPDHCRYFYWGTKTTWKKPVRYRLPPSASDTL